LFSVTIQNSKRLVFVRKGFFAVSLYEELKKHHSNTKEHQKHGTFQMPVKGRRSGVEKGGGGRLLELPMQINYQKRDYKSPRKRTTGEELSLNIFCKTFCTWMSHPLLLREVQKHTVK
jgi:hypothetical protein